MKLTIERHTGKNKTNNLQPHRHKIANLSPDGYELIAPQVKIKHTIEHHTGVEKKN